ncbi:TonB-dependent receptor, partial [Bacteroides sp.]
APKNATLVFSFIGYRTQEVAIKGKTTVNVTLQEDSQMLEEVVAIGYGAVPKRDLTGAVSSLKSEDLLKTNPVSINQGLQGKLAGVNVSQSDGAPGAGVNIQIRGANSFTTSTEPLYIVDGMPYSVGEAPATDYGTKSKNNPLSTISPQDIQSIEVLKDASATAIYGSRAANGVVIITTKSGAEGKAKVQFSANFSVAKSVKTIDVLDACDYANYQNERKANGWLFDGLEYAPDSFTYPTVGRWDDIKEPDPETGEMVVVGKKYKPSPQDFRNGFELNGQMFYGSRWQDQIFRTSFSQDYSISVSGGDKKGSYMYSGGYLDQQGIITNTYYKRYNIRANNTRKINDYIELGANISFTNAENRLARTNTETSGLITSAISYDPTLPLRDPEKESGFSENNSTGLSNPYLAAHNEKNVLLTKNVFASGFGVISFTDWLQFRQNLGYSYSYDERNQYYNRWTSSGRPSDGLGIKNDQVYESLTSESLLTFNKKFGVHAVNVVGGFTYDKVMWRSKYLRSSKYPSDGNEENNIGAGVEGREMTSDRGRSQLMSYLVRGNYNLLDRYMLTFSFRRDGSSRLSPLDRWSNFYSGALAWRLSDEAFIKSLNFFDNLKLRISAGQTGSQSVSPYATRTVLTAKDNNYPFAGSLENGMAQNRYNAAAPTLLSWETTTQYDIGLDASFLNNRVNLVADVYYKKTEGMLMDKMISWMSGFKQIKANFGNVTNKGVEVSLNVIPVKTRSFMWTLDANISFNKNEIGGLQADHFIPDLVWGFNNVFLMRNGHPIGTLYGYVEDGFYDNEAEVRADPYYKNATDAKIKSMVGEIKYKNMDDDPVIDDRDRAIIGDTNPDYQYGLTSTMTYKDWTFSFFLQGIEGNDILNVNLNRFTMNNSDNVPYFVWNSRWTPENRRNAKYPRSLITNARSVKASDRYVQDGSYLRCKNISLSYRLRHPVKYVESINIVASVSNLFTITGYDWFDPDVNAFGGDSSRRGVDLASYPSARTFNLGIQLSF